LKAPIIFPTTRVQEADRISLDLGANDYVTEFFSPRELMERVRGLLKFVENSRQDRKRLEDEVDAASQVQQRLFPSSQSPISGVDYSACAGAWRQRRLLRFLQAFLRMSCNQF
jgi:hypothetical protein